MRLSARKAAACAGLLAAGCLAGPAAHAAIVQYTYTGTVDYGYDRAGIFGADPSLTGTEFTLVERFDTLHNAYRYLDAGRSFQFGGSQSGFGTASLTVTIGGVARSIADVEDYVYSGADGKHLDFVKDAAGYEYAGFYFEAAGLPADYGAPLRLDGSQGWFEGTYQFFSTRDPALATFAHFDVSGLAVTTLTAVPLPASLALFGAALLGLGLGSRLRRRRGVAHQGTVRPNRST